MKRFSFTVVWNTPHGEDTEELIVQARDYRTAWARAATAAHVGAPPKFVLLRIAAHGEV